MFYREAGPPDAPVVVLLHGFPASSYMFRDLLPVLADNHRVIAMDHLGYGFSDAPGVDDFEYTFAALSTLTGKLLDQLGVTRFSMYVHDYGAPIGWRLALERPTAVTGVISQNGNAYEEGFVDSFWEPIWAYTRDPSPKNESAIRTALTLDAIKWQYTNGVPDPSLVSPDTWNHDFAQVSRPGNDLVQLELLRDYQNNVTIYPQVHQFLRESQVPLLAIWGRNDEIFQAAGAQAFTTDLPDAEVELPDGGHFLLESALDEVGGRCHQFLDRVPASV
jgi:pimeloyl-ACP methyl ester carboxylesterase